MGYMMLTVIQKACQAAAKPYDPVDVRFSEPLEPA